MGPIGKASTSRTGHRRPQRGRRPAGFNFTEHLRAVCDDMVTRLSELSHIQMDRVAVSFCQTRKSVQQGLHATLTPMRFEGGSLQTVCRGRRYVAQRLYDPSGREMLYILSFYLPRFQENSFREKIVTTLHELWHISPQFDGDLRRHNGRCYMHSHSKKGYDHRMETLADRWLSFSPREELLLPLRCSFVELQDCFGGVFGSKVPQPKLIPMK